MKVLIGVDGSSNSFAAVEFVGRLLSAEHDELVLLFATPAVSFDDERLDPAVEQRARSALSRTVLNAALERLPTEWQERVTQREAAGSASAALLDAIDAVKADMIAVGFRGTSGIVEKFVLGSVSRAIAHSAKVPALVVKSAGSSEEPAKQSRGSVSQRMHVLLTYDDRESAERAAEILKQFTWPPDTCGTLMKVVPRMFLAGLPEWIKVERDADVAAMAAAWKEEHQQQLQAARSELERFRAALPDCFANDDPIVAEGRPAEEILIRIRETAIDLAVVGSRGRGSIQRLLLGSTSEQVLREAPCSVLVVR
ncbi:MAG TPA: universal stress protein [Lacipirellulaceae bacterium]|nr:universal stress protein [Lacipirellulaceae bacterium]